MPPLASPEARGLKFLTELSKTCEISTGFDRWTVECAQHFTSLGNTWSLSVLFNRVRVRRSSLSSPRSHCDLINKQRFHRLPLIFRTRYKEDPKHIHLRNNNEFSPTSQNPLTTA